MALFVEPSPYIPRAIAQRNTGFLTVRQEANNLLPYDGYFLQIQGDSCPCVGKKAFEFRDMNGLYSAAQGIGGHAPLK